VQRDFDQSPIELCGGADRGLFPLLRLVTDPTNLLFQEGSDQLEADQIVLEIQGRKVAGFTLGDLTDLLNSALRTGGAVQLRTVGAGEQSDSKKLLSVVVWLCQHSASFF